MGSTAVDAASLSPPPRQALQGLQPQALSLRWLSEKYAQPGECTAHDVRQRVAHALALCELPTTRQQWAQRFLQAMDSGLLPAGRIMAGAGVPPVAVHGSSTLINCFVLPLGSLERTLLEVRRTLQAGGGVGLDFSGLSQGVVDAIGQFDAQAQQLEADSRRRAAQMAVLDVRHPEIAAFIAAKQDEARSALPHFNLSVALDDGFMAERQTSGHQPIWHALVQGAWRSGEPGVLFIDSIRRDDNLGHQEQLSATNPCGEQPLPPYGGCCLASIDLTRLIQAPFTDRAHLAWGLLASLVNIGVRLLDNALMTTVWPLPQQHGLVDDGVPGRRIGLGFTGLADALIMLGLRYNSAQARQWAGQLMRFMRNAAYRASVRLARERAAFAGLRVNEFLAPPHFASRLPDDLKVAIRRYGIRHSHLLAIAPAASISVAFADNVSSGMEPVVGWQQLRRWRDPAGQPCRADVLDHAWRLHALCHDPRRPLPSAFVTRHEISGHEQVAMMGALAPYVDGGISKTVELPEGARSAEVESVLEQAWSLGIKGLTVFRRGSRPGVVTGSDPAACASGDPAFGNPRS